MVAFRLPLNIPHAARVAGRLGYHLKRWDADTRADCEPLRRLLVELDEHLFPWLGENDPPEPEASLIAATAAAIARQLVGEIEAMGFGDDRLGQCVRNLFECLSLGEEGARISLRAGENPDSPLRPC